MKKPLILAGTALLALGAFGSPLLAESTGTKASDRPNVTGDLPQDSLPAERRGAIGENPDPVTQQGAQGDRAKAGTPPGVADLPEGSLAEERKKAIGTPPEPVVQGDGEGTTKKE
jgi:hypothetical protein